MSTAGKVALGVLGAYLAGVAGFYKIRRNGGLDGLGTHEPAGQAFKNALGWPVNLASLPPTTVAGPALPAPSTTAAPALPALTSAPTAGTRVLSRVAPTEAAPRPPLFTRGTVSAPLGVTDPSMVVVSWDNGHTQTVPWRDLSADHSAAPPPGPPPVVGAGVPVGVVA